MLGIEAVLHAGAELHPRAVILDRCEVGRRSIVHSGAVIGADGFGFAPLDGAWIKIPQIGRVIIGDDVEIGANTTIDRGTMGDTVVESGAKLDNQVQVGVKFTSATNGEITGFRFYKGPLNTGTHVGDLWSATGTLLATATFTNETASGPATVVSHSITTPGHYTGFFPIMKNRDFEKAAAIVRRLEVRRRVRALGAREQQRMKLDIEEILGLMPHRYPFLLVDRVLELEPAPGSRPSKHLVQRAVFPGAFPGHPVMPGVLIIEALAQAAAVLTYVTLKTSTPMERCFTSRASTARASSAALDPATRCGSRSRWTHQAWRRQVQRSRAVDGELVCETGMMCALRSDKDAG